MKLLSKYIFSALFLAASGGSATAQSMRANTYCNPLNVDYTYMIYNSSNKTCRTVRGPIPPWWSSGASIICS